MNLSSGKILLLLFVVALVPRLALLSVFHGTGVAEQRDAKSYEQVARNVIAGNGFTEASGEPTSVRPPVYPLFLASVYLCGGQDKAAKVLQCFIDAGSAVLVFLIAGLIFPLPVAVLSGFLYALYPPAILYSNLKLSECLFTFLLLAEAYSLVRALVRQQPRFLVWAGLLHGLAILCRPLTILFPFFILPVILLFYRKLLRGFVLFLLISSAIISVWTVRNYRQFKVFMPVNVGTGYSLYLVVLDNIWDGDRLMEPDLHALRPDLDGMSRYQWEKILTREVRGQAVLHPLWYGKKLAENLTRWWTIPVGKVLLERTAPGVARLYKLLFLAFLFIAAGGIVASLKNRFLLVLPVALYLGYILVMFLPFAAAPRYRLPFEPFLLIFFAYGMYWCCRKLRSPGKGSSPLP